MILTLAVFLLFSFMAHFYADHGRLVCGRRSSLLRSDRIVDLAFLVFPVFSVGLIIIGFRPLDAGFDTQNYVRAWLALDGAWSAWSVGAAEYGNTEFLWWPFQSLFSGWLSARGWLLVNYVLAFAMVFWAYHKVCRYYTINPLIFALVFLTYYFVYSGNAMRQTLALPVGLLAFCWFFERRYFKFLAGVIVSVGMHWSALLLIIVPLLKISVFKKHVALLGIPMLMLVGAFLFEDVARLVVGFVGISGLDEKYFLYFEGGREAHVGAVWTRLNFWLCAVVSLLFLYVCPPERYSSAVLQLYVMLFLSLMFFSMSVGDVSERFFPAIFLVMPVMVALVVQRLWFLRSISGFVLMFSFLALWVMIVSTKSARDTLGYTFF